MTIRAEARTASERFYWTVPADAGHRGDARGAVHRDDAGRASHIDHLCSNRYIMAALRTHQDKFADGSAEVPLQQPEITVTVEAMDAANAHRLIQIYDSPRRTAL